MKRLFGGRTIALGSAALAVAGAIIAYIFFAGSATACAGPAAPVPSQGQQENSPAPDFALKDLSGRAVSLADYQGKILILNFWATWCGPCRSEIPGFVDAYKNYKDKGLEILGVTVDTTPEAKLKDWVAKAGINYPVAYATRKILDDYQPGEYIPATIIIDKTGHIRYRHVSVLDEKALVKLFKEFEK